MQPQSTSGVQVSDQRGRKWWWYCDKPYLEAYLKGNKFQLSYLTNRESLESVRIWTLSFLALGLLSLEVAHKVWYRKSEPFLTDDFNAANLARSLLVLRRKLNVLQTNSAKSSVVDTEESRHSHNERTIGSVTSCFPTRLIDLQTIFKRVVSFSWKSTNWVVKHDVIQPIGPFVWLLLVTFNGKHCLKVAFHNLAFLEGNKVCVLSEVSRVKH